MRRLLPATLTGRLVVTTVLLVAVVGLTVSILATVTMQSYLNGRLDQQLHSTLDRTTREFDRLPDGPPPNGEGNLPVPLGQGAGTLTAVMTAEGRRGDIIGEGKQVDLPDAALTVLTNVPADRSARTMELPGVGTYRVIATEGPDGNVVVAGLPTDPVEEILASLFLWEILLTLAGIVAAGVVGRTIVQRQLRPLRDVAATAHQVAALPLAAGEVTTTPRVPRELTDPATEVGRVGDALNVLLDHVERALDDRHASEQRVRRFVADASHELRTPLTTIAGYTELVRRTGSDDPVVLRQAVEKVEAESARMSSLVSDLLLLARLDSRRPLDRDAVDLTRLVMEAVADRRVLDPSRRWRLDLPEAPVEIAGDELRLHQLVTNLLTNATRHTPEGTSITAGLAHADGAVLLTVHDDGPGVDPQVLPRVFDRFARGDSSRRRTSGGAGLGTSIVRAIAEAHGGTATVDSRPSSTTFSVSFPA